MMAKTRMFPVFAVFNSTYNICSQHVQHPQTFAEKYELNFAPHPPHSSALMNTLKNCTALIQSNAIV